VTKEIVRGCEYWLADGRIVEPPYEIEIFFVAETHEFVRRLLAAFALGSVYFGIENKGEEAPTMIPAPRSMSSSCGTR
jgi:hypothetical protein